MKKLWIVLIIGIFLIVLFFAAIEFYDTFLPDDKDSYVDNSEIALDQRVASVKEGLSFAENRAKKWDKKVWLEFAMADFIGKEKIVNRTGKITYFFCVDGLGMFKDTGAKCEVTIDLEKQAIVKFVSRGLFENVGTPPQENIYDSKIDINEIFDIVEAEFGDSMYDGVVSPTVSIVAGGKIWSLIVYDSVDGRLKQSFFTRIDTEKKAIIK